MSEGEIELMQSAIVESYIIKASKIYLTKYIDAGMQKTIAKSYSPTQEVKDLNKKIIIKWGPPLEIHQRGINRAHKVSGSSTFAFFFFKKQKQY